jgi:hypothetical protein
MSSQGAEPQLTTSDEEALPPVATNLGKKHIAAMKRTLADPEATAKVGHGDGKAIPRYIAFSVTPC